MLEYEHMESDYFKTNKPLEMSPEKKKDLNNLPNVGFVKIHLLMKKLETMIISLEKIEKQLINVVI